MRPLKLIRFLLGSCAFLSLSTATVAAQEPAAVPLNIERAVQLARENYPAIRAARAQVESAGAGVDLARNAYLPRAELDWQQTLGTRNNVFGVSFPQPGILPISGPVIDNPSFADGAWGSGGGILLSWEPFDFGLRKAGVKLADSQRNEARARVALTELDVITAAADSFLRVVAADQAVRAAQASVDRMTTFSKSVHVLVENELRPGADASRTDAELAAARNSLIHAKQEAALARVALSEAVGLAGEAMVIDSEPLLDRAPSLSPPSETDYGAHPLALVQKASLDIVLARQRVLDHSFVPRISWQTAVFGRGASAYVGVGSPDSRGYFPDTPNWATGLTITFNVSDIFDLRVRRRQQASNLVVEQARYDQTLQRLKAEEAGARALADAAREYAENGPRQLQAAQETELRVRKRYEAELGTVTDVAEAQRLLLHAEVQSALARLAAWRARLAQAKARGNLNSFLDVLRNAR